MKTIFAKHVPEQSVNYCTEISSHYEFDLDLSFDRKSKFGHYKYWPRTKSHTISINRGLPKPLFLVTYIHELAHLDVMLQFGNKVRPHGQEWKRTFRSLLAPLLNLNTFKPQLLSALANHLKNPKASLSADPLLWKLLFPNNDTGGLSIEDIEIGENFKFKNRIFKKVKTRRTRALCFESKTGNNYLIPLVAKIEKAGD